MLQSFHIDLAALDRSDAVRGRSSCGQRCDGWNAVRHCRTADRLLIKEWIDSVRRVDDELDLAAFDQIDDVGSSFFHLVNTLAHDAGLLERVCRSMRGH